LLAGGSHAELLSTGRHCHEQHESQQNHATTDVTNRIGCHGY
jgi:hypothetical protein